MMGRLGSHLTLRLGIKKANFIGAVLGASLAALLVAGVVLASLVVSNVVSFGPSQVRLAVVLTEIEGLPSPISIGQRNDIKFRIQATQQVADATLWLELKAEGVNLYDPTTVEVTYRHPDDSSRNAVLLAPVDGTLKGTLKSGWNVPAGYDDTGEIRITFLSNAAEASYSVYLWVEGTIGPISTITSPTPTEAANPTPTQPASLARSFVLGAYKDGFTGISGTNADGSSIAGSINSNLKIKAGESVNITLLHGDSLHDLSIYSAPCPDGFCTNPISGGRSANVTSSSPEASITFSYPPAGATLYFYCDYHPDTMNGIINVLP